jgi:predicted O-methyltransferase YrrM
VEGVVKEMKIPLVERLPRDLVIPKGACEGEPRYYKTALLNTLIHLCPRVCLEIGTWMGGSAAIFERYFEEYRPDGFLVTADVKRYTNIASERVHQVKVYPHTLDILKYHQKVRETSLLSGWRERVSVSAKANAAILLGAMTVTGAQAYDFVFVDGDHWNLLKDVEIVERVTKPPKHALLDDTTAYVWKASWDYHSHVKPHWETYDFEDWDIFTGTSLIWKE